jgi:hypothetical protein
MGLAGLVIMQAEGFRAALLATSGKRPVDRLDDVAALAEGAQRTFVLAAKEPRDSCSFESKYSAIIAAPASALAVG